MSDIDDLDDYLNDEPELPSLQELDNELLEKEEHNTESSGDQDSKSKVYAEETGDNTPTEVTENGDQTNDVMKSLEQEFNKVFIKNQSRTEDSNTAASEFQELLQMLSAASMTPSTNTNTTNTTTTTTNTNNTSTDFKDIVSSTLGRLKENNSKLEQDLKSEQQQQQQQQHTTAKSSDDILAQLLDQLVNEDNTDGDNNEAGAGTMDNAILNMLDQMCMKEVLYPSMQEMKTNFELWFQNNSEQSTGEADWLRYTKQRNTIVEIVKIYELPEYSNKTHVSQITDLLDQLEELGDTPAEVANSSSSNPTGNNLNNQGIPQGLNLDEKALENLDQELKDNCKQQ